MELTFVLIFISGVITLAAPSIWPILPLILTSSVSDDHPRPLMVVIGVMVSLMLFALLASGLVEHVGVQPPLFRIFSVLSLLLISGCLLYPPLNQTLQTYIRQAGQWTKKNDSDQDDGKLGSLMTGMILGLIWAPFAGPILETVANLTEQYSLGWEVVLAIFVYACGVGLPLLLIAYWAGQIIRRLNRRQSANRSMQIAFGIFTLLMAIITATRLDDWAVWSISNWL